MHSKSLSPAACNGEARQRPEKRPAHTATAASAQAVSSTEAELAEHAAAIRALGRRVVADVIDRRAAS